MSQSRRIRVLSVDSAAASREAASLRSHLLDSASDVVIDIVKEDGRTQDAGATLVLVLGAPAAIAIAQGIADWLRKRRIGSTLELEIGGNRIKATGEIAENPKQLERLIVALGGKG